MEEKELNLCELLKGHEGETFYTTILGYVKIYSIDTKDNDTYPILLKGGACLTKEGKFSQDGECVIFPSIEQRDWRIWAEKQKQKTPKTWDEMVLCGKNKYQQVLIRPEYSNGKMSSYVVTGQSTPIEKSALALLKIHQLIEVGYGGNITQEEWNDVDVTKHCINITPINKGLSNTISYVTNRTTKRIIAFHTEKQREEFLSYPENVKLINDFYMVG